LERDLHLFFGKQIDQGKCQIKTPRETRGGLATRELKKYAFYDWCIYAKMMISKNP
jgi:hypothetical protein